MRRKSIRRKLVSEINVTPFVDVLLIILVIFMITAPVITTQFDVNLPQAGVNNNQTQLPNYLVLDINVRGEIFVEGKKINSLKDEFAEINKASQVLIQADKDVRYQTVITVMDTLKKIGFNSISLVTEVK